MRPIPIHHLVLPGFDIDNPHIPLRGFREPEGLLRPPLKVLQVGTGAGLAILRVWEIPSIFLGVMFLEKAATTVSEVHLLSIGAGEHHLFSR